MVRQSVLFFVLAFFATISNSFALANDHPVVYVIELLKKLKIQAIEDGKEEWELNNKLEHWCERSKLTLNKAIAKEENEIAVHKDTISSLQATVEALEKELKKVDEKLLQLDNEDFAANAIRKSEEDLYQQESESLGGTIKAVEEAIRLLEAAQSNTATMPQVGRKALNILATLGQTATAEQRSLLQGFADEENDDPVQAEGDRAKHVKKYSFKSEGVIEMLKDMKLKFEDELLGKTKTETSSKNAHELAMDAREKVRTATGSVMTAKQDEKLSSNQTMAQTQGELESLEADLKVDTESLKETATSCNIKANEWERRSKTREQEKEAIETAISVLAKVSGVRTEAPGNPVPPPSPLQSSPSPSPSFLQIGLKPQAAGAANILRLEAQKVHSRNLEQLAKDVEKHGDGPFDQVVNAIQKMIFQLKNEQTKEDEHKNWCDQELSKTEKSKTDTTNRLEELSSELQVAQSSRTLLDDEITELEKLVATFEQHMQEATEIRQIGEKENSQAIKDAQDAQAALANAFAVLEGFYKNSGMVAKETWEFLQGPVKLESKPETWDSSYTGVADPAAEGGILSELKVAEEKFSEMESETKAQEAQDQREFEDERSSVGIEKARRTEEIKQKTQKRARLQASERSLATEQKQYEGELHRTKIYMKDLEKPCVDGDSTHEERKAARQGEIEALGEAQEMLQGAFEKAGSEEESFSPSPSTFLARKRHGSGVVMRPN